MSRVWRLILLVVVLSLPVLSAVPAAAVAPGTDAFWRTWARTDKPVQDGTVIRSWMWGPDAFTDVFDEDYVEAPDGTRQVQYFDKSRMEITRPADDPTSEWYVSNGLLVVEMISGQLQVGDTAFEPMPIAEINVAGDLDDPDGPTYRTFRDHTDDPALPLGSVITQTIARDGTVGSDVDTASYQVTVAAEDPYTHHAIASHFQDFIEAQGPIYVNDTITTGVISGLYATGRPITEAYWTTVRVDGHERNVLVQCFERRCLTYTPDNSPAWQVEMGNVGRHYHQWRYSRIPTSEIFIMNVDGSGQRPLTESSGQDGGPVWSPDGSTIAFFRWHNGSGGLFAMDADGTNVRWLSDIAGYGLSWSPDSQRIAVAGVVPNEYPQIYVIAADGSGQQRLTSHENIPTATLSIGNSWPAWSPDGQQIAFVSSQIDGPSEIYVIDTDGTNPQRLTDFPGFKGGPVWIADGTQIAFWTDAANADIWTVRRDGTEVRNLTASPAIEVEMAWSPVRQQLAFVRQSDAGIDVVTMNADGTNEHVLYESPSHVFSMRWSPDGHQIAFVYGNPERNSDIVVLDVDTGVVHQLTDTPSSELNPDWSPDGMSILYVVVAESHGGVR